MNKLCSLGVTKGFSAKFYIGNAYLWQINAFVEKVGEKSR